MGKETSPHAWSKLRVVESKGCDVGNISTCVEQTHQKDCCHKRQEKHLHMRGANSFMNSSTVVKVETSPHAWSKRSLSRIAFRKHLHMRGANLLVVKAQTYKPETSPHAWSKHGGSSRRRPDHRNISTCVEQTRPGCPTWRPCRKHLHMRGANFVVAMSDLLYLETSPHAWSKPSRKGSVGNYRGNISTCVEQTGGQT